MEVTMVNDRRSGALGDMRVLPDEIICDIISVLSPPDVARLSCVSSVMYIFCNEEPLWMTLCLNNLNGLIEYKGSWKKTTLQQGKTVHADDVSQIRPLQFDGFYSLFLYRRLYRCYTTLGEFSVDNGNVERKGGLSPVEFRDKYDGTKPVLISGLADNWPARKTWTLDQLVLKYGDMPFRISQRSSKKIKMKLKDYVSYMKHQHDEDPLYIFDEKFGEMAPDLLKDYVVPDLFQEDLFDVLGTDQRPPFRWLIIGPERSGASWHVDPALTSAWNTLLCGRKRSCHSMQVYRPNFHLVIKKRLLCDIITRTSEYPTPLTPPLSGTNTSMFSFFNRWALYPPGKVPLGVTVHVDEEDGDVNIDTPSSLQWWLDFYPLLPDEDKPIECTQLPGETIFVPSGWWHCVLNLEPTIAVTQNFVNTTNFEFVCLDLAPGYRHKGVCRAGLLATDDANFEEMDVTMTSSESCFSPMDDTRREKRLRTQHVNHDITGCGAANCCSVWRNDLPYEITFLSGFLDEYRDHYNSVWSPSNCIGQREMREWLWKLWIGRPGLRKLIWKGACLAVNAGKWYDCLIQICQYHNLSSPGDNEKLPVGTGSNPVFLVGDNVVKIYVEGGLEPSLYCLGTELEFYNLLLEVKSPLREHVPDVLACGFISLDNGSYTLVPWDGKGIPDMIADDGSLIDSCKSYSTPFGLWSKKLFECKVAGLPVCESGNISGSKRIWPYIVTKRCKGKIFAEIRDSLSWENALDLASFLGEQLHNLRMLPVPHLDHTVLENIKHKVGGPSAGVNFMEVGPHDIVVWEIFLHNLAIKRKSVVNNLTKWGHPIPTCLIEKALEYLPDDFEKLLPLFVDETCSWIHSDIMDDNLYLEPLTDNCVHDRPEKTTSNGSIKNGEGLLWKPSYILDFSDLSIGDPIFDLIPIHLDIFRGDPRLLKRLLVSYKLPLLRKNSMHDSPDKFKFGRASYRAMCYCILHDDNVLGAVFSIWDDLRDATSWEQVEEMVWGILNE